MPDTDPPPDSKRNAVVERPELPDGDVPQENGRQDVDKQSQVAMLETKLDSLEGDRESLRERVRELESQVGTLERERNVLEESLTLKEKQRQHAIEQYERLLAETERYWQERAEGTKLVARPQSVPDGFPYPVYLLWVYLSVPVRFLRGSVRRLGRKFQ